MPQTSLNFKLPCGTAPPAAWLGGCLTAFEGATCGAHAASLLKATKAAIGATLRRRLRSQRGKNTHTHTLEKLSIRRSIRLCPLTKRARNRSIRPQHSSCVASRSAPNPVASTPCTCLPDALEKKKLKAPTELDGKSMLSRGGLCQLLVPCLCRSF